MNRAWLVYLFRQERRRDEWAGMKHFVTLLAGLAISCVVGQSQIIQSLPGIHGNRENQRTAELVLAHSDVATRKSSTAATKVKPQLVAFVGDNVFPQFVDGGGWSTAITVRNLDTKQLHFQILFLKDDGTDLFVPVVGLGEARGVDITLNVNGSVTFETEGSSPSLSVGWAYILKDNYQDVISGFGIFRSRSLGRPDFEAVVPVVNQFDSHFVLMYDNSAGYVTGMAVANPTGNSVTIPVTIYDDRGNIIDQQSISLDGYSHVAFALPTVWQSTGGNRGSIEFRTSGFGVGVLGLRFNPGGAFTSFAVMSNINWLK